MKFLSAAAIGAALLASPAAAQTAPATSACASFSPAPATPDGARATREAMAAAVTRMDAWSAQRLQEQAACQAEIAALRAQLEGMIGAYNDAAQERFATVSAWNGEVEQFAARGGRRPATN